MSWIQRYRLRHYLRNSVWVLPVFGIVTGLVSVRGLSWIEVGAGWKFDFDPDAARALFGTLAGALFTFIVFLSSILLLVLQLAGAQLTPRVIGIVFRDHVTRFALTLFSFTFTFTLAVLLRIDTAVPALTAHVSAYLCLFSVGVFLFLMDHVGKLLRPSGALQAVAHMGREVIRSVYLRRFSGQEHTLPDRARALGGEPACTVPNPRDGVLLAFDQEGLVALAQKAQCVIELVPQGGGFRVGSEPAVPHLRRHRRAIGPCAL